MRKTKIICTIGPASESEAVLEKMCKSGMNVARLNFSHGTHEDHKKKIDLIKRVRERLGLPIAIMLDTKGPEFEVVITALLATQLTSKSIGFTETDRSSLIQTNQHTTRKRIEVVITGLTRNQLYLTVPWVRIPPLPPTKNALLSTDKGAFFE